MICVVPYRRDCFCNTECVDSINHIYKNENKKRKHDDITLNYENKGLNCYFKSNFSLDQGKFKDFCTWFRDSFYQNVNNKKLDVRLIHVFKRLYYPILEVHNMIEDLTLIESYVTTSNDMFFKNYIIKLENKKYKLVFTKKPKYVS